MGRRNIWTEEKISEARKELYRKERLRVTYELSRQTKLKNKIMKILRRIKAKRYGVPFCTREWYNHLAHIREEDANGIIIFDNDDRYIDPPKVGGLVTYRYKKQLYQYRVVAYKNESRYRDWLYDTDYIHPVIEFVRKL